MNERRAKIEAMLEDEPQDLFLRYSLALEMNKDGELEGALSHLAGLCDGEPPYVPAFFRSAQLLAEDQNIDTAREFLRRGIDEARAQGDLHAAGEMSEMLSDLGQFGE
ncbi:hypothetical protein [Aureliella helgolandensis]|uniref:Tetratricopeptide repeat protein n=1 Tax=Aureliella helgolandensis TaxID=2527968 RepID=A0A518GDJ1_9BACT|nr:hypothetical protein [Aureliella helgolandensis]QDV26610.1 hypothetical protein Q31a_49840 [Aureliella helgolandensis]